jgi:hypothetical protein
MKTLPKFLKPAKSGDTLRIVYLYRDGHAVALFERRDRDTGVRGEYVKIAARPQDLHLQGDWDRLVLRETIARVLFTLPGKHVGVQAAMPALLNGSENCKRRGLAVSTLTLTSDYGWLMFNSIPEVMSDDFTVQQGKEYAQAWESLLGKNVWGVETNILNCYDFPKPPPDKPVAVVKEN